jgi:hypothetical protein
MTELPRNMLRRYPFVVQMAWAATEGRLHTISAWHRYSAVPQQRHDAQGLCRWCFEDERIAETLRRRFGGEVLPPAPDTRRSRCPPPAV